MLTTQTKIGPDSCIVMQTYPHWAWFTPADLSPLSPTTTLAPQARHAAAQPHPATLSGNNHFTPLSVERFHALVTWFKHSPSYRQPSKCYFVWGKCWSSFLHLDYIHALQRVPANAALRHQRPPPLLAHIPSHSQAPRWWFLMAIEEKVRVPPLLKEWAHR